jgi:hypothetical protein
VPIRDEDRDENSSVSRTTCVTGQAAASLLTCRCEFAPARASVSLDPMYRPTWRWDPDKSRVRERVGNSPLVTGDEFADRFP